MNEILRELSKALQVIVRNQEILAKELKNVVISIEERLTPKEGNPLQAHCTKCGEEVLGNENSLCGYCIHG